MDHSPAIAFIKDMAGQYTYVNQPFLTRFQLQRTDVIGKNDTDLWPAATAQEVRAHDAAVLAQRQAMHLTETAPGPDGQTHSWQVHKFCVPEGDGNVLGGIGLDITETIYYEQQLEAYQRQLEHLITKLEAQNLTDALTGIANRRAFQARLDEEIGRAIRYELPLALLILDIDHFKRLNDTFGHPVGDRVLHDVAQALTHTARSADTVARYGGEEFVVILPNTTAQGALILAERFRRLIATIIIGDVLHITTSIGAAVLSATTPDATYLVAAADAALYRAKQTGRNRVVLASPDKEQ